MLDPVPAVSRPLLQSLLSLAWVVEARDPYTGGHLWRVAQFSMLLARSLGLDRHEVARIGLGGFLHDLGKIAVPDSILNKLGKLTDEEYAVIKTHPRIGGELLAAHPLGALAWNAVVLHHETPDGRGYPNGFTSDGIPMEARIIGLADAFDAMTSTRPYRKGMAPEKALQIVEENLGTQFDRALGVVFLEMGRRGGLDHVIGHSESGIPLQACVLCGPTIVVTREHKDGDMLYCRGCGGGMILHRSGNRISFTDTDVHAAPVELSPAIDTGLLGDLLAGDFAAV